jgi:hypothetical protein
VEVKGQTIPVLFDDSRSGLLHGLGTYTLNNNFVGKKVKPISVSQEAQTQQHLPCLTEGLEAEIAG